MSGPKSAPTGASLDGVRALAEGRSHVVDDGVLQRYVREHALASVAANLTPAPLLLLPFTLLVSRVMRGDLPGVRFGWWVLSAVVTTAFTLLALYGYHKRGGTDSTPWYVRAAFAAAFATMGAVFGMSPWVVANGRFELVLLFLLFPATASAVGCIVTAGRRDLYLWFLTPLCALSSVSLLTTDDERLKGLGMLAGFFGAALVLLHHVLSRGTVDAIGLQIALGSA